MKIKRQRKVFYFKRFALQHDHCVMKVGTDAVLLGSWVTISNTRHILDVGTGSGVIALMLAQRTNDDVQIDAIEIEERDATQAKENVLNSPWSKKVEVYQKSLQVFESEYKYDLIVSNPPYFINSLHSPTRLRTQARHTVGLSFRELIEHSVRLLNSKGRLAVVLPFAEGNTFKLIAKENKLHLIRETAFYSREEKPQERWLFEFGLEASPSYSDRIVLYEKDSIQSEQYINLTKDFYL